MSNRIESANLTLTYTQFADANDILRGVRESLKECSPWLVWAVQDYNLKHAQAFVQSAVEGNQSGKMFNYTIRTKMGSFVGSVGLTPQPDPMGRSGHAYQIGYWITTPQTGKGYASEAVQALANHTLSFLKAARVEILTDSNNLASAKAAQKAGFVQEARLKNTRKNPDDTLADTLVFAKIT
jgi:ribosomal-protein-serine acetyltransferase